MYIKPQLILFFLTTSQLFGYSSPVPKKYAEHLSEYKELRQECLSHKKTWLVSFPHSGNTWVRYCIEVLSKRATFDIGRNRLPTQLPLSLLFDNNLDDKKEPVFKAHHRHEMKLESNFNKEDKLIVLVRNPKEVFLRQKPALPKERDCIECPPQSYLLNTCHSYFKILDLFESWDPTKRHLIYYEDLITDLPTTLTSLLCFLGESSENIDAFMTDIVFHQQQSIDIYTLHGGIKGTITDTNYYTKDVDVQKLIAFDMQLETQYPQLWQSYLKERYASS